MELYDLLQRAKNNDKDAAYEIIKDFNPTLKKLSNSLHHEEAETDLIIELLKLIQIDIAKFNNSNNKQIAKYIHIHLKKRTLDLLKSNENKFKEYLEINHDILADESIVDIEISVLTSILIESLVSQQRDIITMEFIHGFSEKDIARILGISRQAVNRTKNRALKNLRKIYIEDGGESIGRKNNRTSLQSRNMDTINSCFNILYSQKSRKKGSSSRRKRN
ncbi:RNA polymerase sigma factor [Tepidibacter formicigenes]|jgi:RNA polymerase sigma factor (sigma-70 family)|uniref:RNA polymerase sigma factor, sigma-70 family n=1 Tax=Tepidibacter formicigenes DSM 15518 TaxID=1123349 RepID=A0A1M6SAI2_9FIRM|nr:sigma-70 family RNA polymerase sigma factor [Tepidibacter formicigenes]SHK41784.1 RNA polymerase sigma factor, sigma-70 family [Tepidibacter formicigenes DSM 15518]